MINYLKPTYFKDSFQDINKEFLQEYKITTILSDLDGTLAPEDEMADSNFEIWLKMLKESNVKLIITSNNYQERVNRFIEKYQLEGYGLCKKPKTEKIQEYIKIEENKKEEILLLGDQIFTDVWCGKKLGIKTVIVKPIPGNEAWRTKIKRGVEKIFLKIWRVK